jgi:DNA-binding NtrC family response regulator
MRANQLETIYAAPELLGSSAAAETARAYVARASDTHDPALVSAERGLDSLAVCRAIHAGSDLTANPFVAIDCFHQTAETFDQDISRVATRRTVALRNLDELPLVLQRRLADLLHDDVAHGGHAGTRVVATLTGNVEDAIAEGRLSRDLCMRFPLHVDVPPLRKRSADIPLLIGCVAADVVAGSGMDVPAFSREALALLSALPWRRNLEELREVLDALVLVADGGTVRLDDVLEHVPIEPLWTRAPGTVSLREARNDFEREYIAAVLNRHRGRMDEAARSLGVQRTNLYRKVKQLGIGRARSRR